MPHGRGEPRNEHVLDSLVPLHALAQDDGALSEFRVGQPGGLPLERADRPDDRREVVGRLRGRFAAQPAQKSSEPPDRHRAATSPRPPTRRSTTLPRRRGSGPRGPCADGTRRPPGAPLFHPALGLLHVGVEESDRLGLAREDPLHGAGAGVVFRGAFVGHHKPDSHTRLPPRRRSRRMPRGVCGRYSEAAKSAWAASVSEPSGARRSDVWHATRSGRDAPSGRRSRGPHPAPRGRIARRAGSPALPPRGAAPPREPPLRRGGRPAAEGGAGGSCA